MKLIAEDIDSQPNGQIHFSIVNGDRDNEFAVDPVLGLVKVKKKLDRERVSSFRPACFASALTPSLKSRTQALSVLVRFSIPHKWNKHAGTEMQYEVFGSDFKGIFYQE